MGGNSTTTNIYDPVNGGTYGSFSDPGSNAYLNSAANTAALSFQRPDGKYIVLSGGGATTSTLYDAGWNTTGTWISEDILSTKISTYSAISWTMDQQSTNNTSRLDGSTVDVYVRTGIQTTDLLNNTWLSIQNSGDLIQTIGGAQHIQIKVVLSTPIRSYPQLVTSYINQSNVWGGETYTFNRRSFLDPSLFSLTIQNPMVQYGGLASDPQYGRNFATAGALLEGVVTNNNNQLSLAINRNLPSSTPAAGFIIASASGNLPFTEAAGGHAIAMPNGQFMIIGGNNTKNTAIYDPDSNTFTLGPLLPNAAGAGAHSIQLPNGQFLVILGNNSKFTAILTPQPPFFITVQQCRLRRGRGQTLFSGRTVYL